MIKTIGFVLLWLAGAGVAVAVAWTGVAIVDDEIINPAPATLNPQTVADTAINNPTTTVAPNPVDGSVDPTLDVTSDTVAETSTNELTSLPSTAAPPASTTSAPTTSPSTSAPTTSPPTTTAPTPTSTSTTQESTPTTQPAQIQNFNLVGGSTAISFSASSVHVLWATPNPGFEVKIEPEAPGIKVEFEADHHESRIDAWWSGGPQHQIREKPDN